jgi:uncharacterized protein (TIGR02246 family)
MNRFISITSRNNIVKYFFCLLCFFISITNAQEKTTSNPDTSVYSGSCNNHADEQAFREIIDRWKDGYNNGNAEKVTSLYTTDAYYLTQHFVTGIVKGHAAIKAYVQNGIDAKYHIDSIKILSMDCSDDFAYVITRYNSTNNGHEDFGVNIVVLKRMGGKWLIVAHESAVPDQATAIQQLNILK